MACNPTSSSSSAQTRSELPSAQRLYLPSDAAAYCSSSPWLSALSRNLSSSATAAASSSSVASHSLLAHPETVRPPASDQLRLSRLNISSHDSNSPHSSQFCFDGNEIQELMESGLSLGKAMIAGATAGMIEHVSMFPVDTIKTRMQALAPESHKQYTSVRNAITRITREEGFLRLYRGVSAVVAAAIPSHAVHYATYELMKEQLGANESGHRPVETAISGGVATMAHDAVVTPLDVVKQRLQVFNSQYPTVIKAARRILAEEGFRGFYASYPTTVAMNLPFVSVYFTVYESMKLAISGSDSHHESGFKEHLIAGALSGASAGWVSTPFDVVKTRIQTQHSAIADGIQLESAVGTIGMARRIFEKEGYIGFFRGASARMLYFAPSAAICWTTYETLKRLLKDAW